ncbi:hypothetical protein [Bifidobacterium bifidum]|uniref:hypothetical protein n=1 Tax=Bifidobacterium bifidum TaxID=1681 RepID=UPI001E401DE4|nr:hypothetical protein [Bifidobacterium bifidum]
MIFGAVDVPLLHFYPAKVLFQDVMMGLSQDKDIFVQILAVFFQVGGDEDEPESAGRPR